MSRSLVRFLLVFVIGLALFFTVIVTRTVTPSHAVVPKKGNPGLAVSVGYAETKSNNPPQPGAFPSPWSGSPNITFLGGTVPGQTACGTIPACYDTGAILIHNNGSAAITINGVSVDVHSVIPGGKLYNLWGTFTVPAGQGVILAENPPTTNSLSDNFDTSATPNNNCTPISIAPTVSLTIGSATTTLVDTAHILDTGGIDSDSCGTHPNESTQWQSLGTVGVNSPILALNPSSTIQLLGKPVIEAATVHLSNGSPLANTKVTFTVTSGPNAGKSVSAITNNTGHAQFTYTSAASGSDTIVATVARLIGTFQSNLASVTWSNTAWSAADIGSPPLAGSQSLSNGIWTVAGSGSDIGGTVDQFHFVWESLTTDGGISAQVISQTNTNSLARAGVMLRLSTNPSAPFYAVVVTPQQGIFVLDRATQGGGVSTVTSLAGTVPVYLKVQRTGTTFTASTSSDGITWTLIPGSSVTLNLTGTLLAGMAVTSHTASKVSTATFGAVTSP